MSIVEKRHAKAVAELADALAELEASAECEVAADTRERERDEADRERADRERGERRRSNFRLKF